MTPKTFFMLFFKIVGLYLLKDLLYSTTILLPMLASLVSGELMESGNILTISGNVLLLVVILLCIYFCLIKPEKIVSFLRFEKGFSEEKFEINISKEFSLLSVIILLSGYIIVTTLPYLLTKLHEYNTMRSFFPKGNDKMKYSIIANVVTIFLAILLFLERKPIIKYLLRDDKKQETENEKINSAEE